MDKNQLSVVLEQHKKWLKGQADGQRADLRNADLSGADLSYANLRSANLSDANLSDANLRDANLHSADLIGANLRSADLRDANLSYADLSYANLRSANLSDANLSDANLRDANLHSADLIGANLHGANLSGADLSGANLHGANLRSANLRNAKHDQQTTWGARQWLPLGTLRLFKKVATNEGYERILTLRIPAEADRTSAFTGRKVRVSFAIVEKAETIDGSPVDETEWVSAHDSTFTYRLGEMAVPDAWDPNPLIECTSGIHAFITREEAVAY